MYAILAGQFWEQLARKGRGADKQYTSWFEAMVIHKLAVGGKFAVRNLKNGSTAAEWEELVLHEVPIEMVHGSGAESVNDTFYTEWGKLTSRTKMLNPSSTNLPVVDCADKAGRGFRATPFPLRGAGRKARRISPSWPAWRRSSRRRNRCRC